MSKQINAASMCACSCNYFNHSYEHKNCYRCGIKCVEFSLKETDMKMRLMFTVQLHYINGDVDDHWYTFNEKEANEMARVMQNEFPVTSVLVKKDMRY